MRIIGVRVVSPPENLIVCYPRSVFEEFMRRISELASSTGEEVLGAWLGTVVGADNDMKVLALKPLLLQPKDSSAAHAVIDGMTLLDLERIGHEDALSPVVLVHTHNWLGGHEFFSARDEDAIRLLCNPLLVFAVVEPYTGSISHWRMADGTVKRVDYHVIDDSMAMMTRDGNILPLEGADLRASLRELKETVVATDAALRSLSLKIDDLLLRIPPQPKKGGKLLDKILKRLRHD